MIIALIYLQLCGVRTNANTAARSLFWQPRKGLSFVLTFESERDRNAAIMLARKYAYDCNGVPFYSFYFTCQHNLFSIKSSVPFPDIFAGKRSCPSRLACNYRSYLQDQKIKYRRKCNWPSFFLNKMWVYSGCHSLSDCMCVFAMAKKNTPFWLYLGFY